MTPIRRALVSVSDATGLEDLVRALHGHGIEIVASSEHFHELVSHEVSPQLWRSVDGAVQKMEQQLRKHKEKVRDHKHVQSSRRS